MKILSADIARGTLSPEDPALRVLGPTTARSKSTDYRELAFASSLQAFGQQRDQLLALLVDLPDQGWSRTATVLGVADH